MQNPDRGKAYLTFWKMNENMDAEKTFKIHDNPVSCTNLQQEGLYLGVGASDGAVKIVNVRRKEIEVDAGEVHAYIVKGVSFTEDARSLLSGAPDYAYYFLPNIRPAGKLIPLSRVNSHLIGWVSFLIKLWVGITVLIYLLMTLKEKFSK